MIDRIITTTNENPSYIEFWPVMTMFWRIYTNIPITLGFITQRSDNDHLVKKMKQFGDVIAFPPIENIDSGVQAKATRMFLASIPQFAEDICMIVDIDLFPLNSNCPWMWLNEVNFRNRHEVAAIGHNAYKGTPDEGKWPMCYTTALGSTFFEFINPDNKDYINWFKSLFDLQVFDSKEATNHPFSRYSDESTMRALAHLWKENHRIRKIVREDFPGYYKRAYRRIDRANFKYNINLLKKGFYIDCSPIRPYTSNLNLLKGILDYYNINIEDTLLSEVS